MKNLLITITLLIVVSSLSAQDKIYFKDGSTIEAKVLVVSESNIQYKKFDNQSGPTFEIGLSNINMIVYEKGSHQMFNEESNNISKGFRKNRMNLDLLAIGENGPTSISYEIINEDGSRGLEIPLSIYFNENGVSGYTVGTNIKFYTNKQGKGFFIGPSIGLGTFNWFANNQQADKDFSAFLGLKLGYQFQVSDLFGINLAGNGGGISNFSDFDFGYSLNLGINFSF